MDFDPDSFLEKIEKMLATEAVGPDQQEHQSCDQSGDLSDDWDDEGVLSSADEGEEEREEGEKIAQMMEEMDLELEDTTVGKSFEKVSVIEWSL